MSEPLPALKWMAFLEVVFTRIGSLIYGAVILSAVAALGYVGWQNLPTKPAPVPATVAISAPTEAALNSAFLVSYTGTAPVTWLDPKADGLFIHAGPETRSGDHYSGSAAVVLSKPGTFSIGVGIPSGHEVLQDWGTIKTKGSTPPSPVDPVKPFVFEASIREAFSADTTANKVAKAAELGELFVSIVPAAKEHGTIKTALDFQQAVKKATDLTIGADSLPLTRKAIGGYLKTVLTTDPNAPADEAYWTRAGFEYGNLGSFIKTLR